MHRTRLNKIIEEINKPKKLSPPLCMSIVWKCTYKKYQKFLLQCNMQWAKFWNISIITFRAHIYWCQQIGPIGICRGGASRNHMMGSHNNQPFCNTACVRIWISKRISSLYARIICEHNGGCMWGKICIVVFLRHVRTSSWSQKKQAACRYRTCHKQLTNLGVQRSTHCITTNKMLVDEN